MQFTSKDIMDIIQEIKPGLYLVSTPIGNLGDITLRAIHILKGSELILCEDTRNSKKILSKFNINAKLMSYHKFNERKKLAEIIELLKNNKIISLVSDAGTPAISDPGNVLIKECVINKITIYPIPGPSSITSAFSVSGFGEKFFFYGFLKSTENQIENEIKKIRDIPYAIIFFVPSNKVNKIFKFFKMYFSDRKIMIAKEMTKIYESFIRGDISSLNLENINLKGELTVVISNKTDNKKKGLIQLSESVKKEIRLMAKKYSSKDVAKFISKKEQISKKLIYDYCLNLKK